MHPISRRTFLAAGAAVVAAACSDNGDADSTTTTAAASTTSTSTTEAATTTEATTTTSTLPRVELSADPFTLGVASGEPDPVSVVLWTRLAPDPLNGGGMPDDDVEVTWEISDSADFATVAASGVETATLERGHTVHAIVPLDQGSWFYRFRVGQYTSPVGTTRAAPDASVNLAETNFAVANCQNYANGQYAAHRDLAEHEPDFVVFLGDYIYEDPGVPGNEDPTARVHIGPEPTTLEEYRNRYARYKTDPHLKAAHAVCPWFVIWDDHEVENNYAGETPQAADDAPTFPARRFAAYQAWWEHQAVRFDPPVGPNKEYRTYRDVHWGDLIDLALLDGRQYRTDQACGDVTLSVEPPCAEVLDPARTMLGDEQETWLFDALAASTATWNVIGNQTVFADATLNGAVLNYDQWDGYPLERARILQHLADSSVPNVVVLTGDIHLAAVAQLRAGDRAVGPPVGAEFITTSISSAGLISDQFTDVLKSYPHLVDAELTHRGYALHSVTAERWTAEYRIVTDVSDAASEVTTLGTYVVDAGTNLVTKAS
jgi:alkaline phosphatase D